MEERLAPKERCFPSLGCCFQNLFKSSALERGVAGEVERLAPKERRFPSRGRFLFYATYLFRYLIIYLSISLYSLIVSFPQVSFFFFIYLYIHISIYLHFLHPCVHLPINVCIYEIIYFRFVTRFDSYPYHNLQFICSLLRFRQLFLF